MKTYVLHKRRTKTGIGLVAGEDIPKGSKLVEYTGNLLPDDDNLPDSSYLMQAAPGWVIDGSTRKNVARYFNHSCRPNCVARYASRKRVFIYSKRKIKAGEELTFNYGKEYFLEKLKGKCLCVKCDS